MADPLPRLRAAVSAQAAAAASLPWAATRRWRPETHLAINDGQPVVDLHDLSVALGVEVVERLITASAAEGFGSMLLITGRGKHNADQRSPLREAVIAAVDELRKERPGLTLRAAGPGRIVLVWDSARAADMAVGRLGWAFWAGVLAFVLLATVVAPPLGLVLFLICAAVFFAQRSR